MKPKLKWKDDPQNGRKCLQTEQPTKGLIAKTDKQLKKLTIENTTQSEDGQEI